MSPKLKDEYEKVSRELKASTQKIDMAKILLIGLGVLILSAAIYMNTDHPTSAEITNGAEAPSHWLVMAEKFCEHLGVAIIVAGIVGWLFERRSQKEMVEQGANTLEQMREQFDVLLEKFRGSAFSAVYGWIIPKRFMHAVDKQVFRKRLIRENWNATYSLRPFTDEEKEEIKEKVDPKYPFERRLIVDVTIEGVLNNKGEDSIDLPLLYTVEKEDAEAFNKCTLMEIVALDSPHVFSKRFEGEELQEEYLLNKKNDDERLTAPDMENKLCINNWYETPEVTLRPHTRYRMTITAKYARGLKHSREVMTIMSLTERLHIKVKSEIPGLEIFGELLTGDSFHVGGPKNNRTFHSTLPLLPHQGYMVWWNNKKICSTGYEACSSDVDSEEASA